MKSDKGYARRRFLELSSLLAAGIARAANPDQASKRSGAHANSAPRKTSLTLNVRDFGARGDGTTKDTFALQQAIDRCWVLGGGEVLVPAGDYLTGALALRSNTILRLQQGCPDRRVRPNLPTIR